MSLPAVIAVVASIAVALTCARASFFKPALRHLLAITQTTRESYHIMFLGIHGDGHGHHAV